MGTYTARFLDRKNLALFNDNIELGYMRNKKWYSFETEIFLPNDSYYVLKPMGFWQSEIVLIKENITLLKYRMNFKGIEIHTFFDKEEQIFLLKTKGIFKNGYVLLDQHKNEICEINYKMNWSDFNNSYTLVTTDEFEEHKFSNVFLLSIIHALNYYTTMLASA